MPVLLVLSGEAMDIIVYEVLLHALAPLRLTAAMGHGQAKGIYSPPI